MLAVINASSRYRQTNSSGHLVCVGGHANCFWNWKKKDDSYDRYRTVVVASDICEHTVRRPSDIFFAHIFRVQQQRAETEYKTNGKQTLIGSFYFIRRRCCRAVSAHRTHATCDASWNCFYTYLPKPTANAMALNFRIRMSGVRGRLKLIMKKHSNTFAVYTITIVTAAAACTMMMNQERYRF